MRPESSAASWLKFFSTAGIHKEYAEHYAVTFSKNQIQLDMLPEINKDYLNDMGINLLGHVIAILRHAKLVYADEIKRSELMVKPVVKKVEPKVTKPSKEPKPAPVKTSKAPPKVVEEVLPEKPTSSVVKRKSSIVQQNSEPKAKVRKNLCDSSDDVNVPKPAPTVRLPSEQLIPDEIRRGVFKRLGGEVGQPAPENPKPQQPETLPSQYNVNGVFSRLGEKTEPPQVVRVKALPVAKEIIKKVVEPTPPKPQVVRKSIIRTRLDKPQEKIVQKPIRTILPQAHMDRELLKTEKRTIGKVLSNNTIISVHPEAKDIKSRLGLQINPSSNNLVLTRRAPATSVKKVSFGSVSEKLIPKVGGQKFSSFGGEVFPVQKLAQNRRPVGVFRRLGITRN